MTRNGDFIDLLLVNGNRAHDYLEKREKERTNSATQFQKCASALMLSTAEILANDKVTKPI